MTEPSKFDDDWAELARELERDKPSSPPPRSEDALPAGEYAAEGSVEPHAELIEATSSEEFDEGAESESSDDSAAGDDQPGTGRKRRRRRRRRRKGAGAQQADAATTDGEESEKAEADDSESEAQPAAAEPEFYDEESSEIVDDRAISSRVDDPEEDAGGELLRELIANWNVPSWDDVVSGLYRPER